MVKKVQRKKLNEIYFLPLEMMTYCYICITKRRGSSDG